MADKSDTPSVQELVGTLAEHVAERLTATADDAQRRHETLLEAKKDAGNRARSNTIRTSLQVENELMLDARALRGRVTPVKRSISSDLERLIEVAGGEDDPD
jgi:hypothetical protein